MVILRAKWMDASHTYVLAEVVNSHGVVVNTYINKPPPGEVNDWAYIETWIAAGGVIEPEE